MPPRIVIISGSPGSGKTSVARLLAENSPYNRAVHMHTDDFYQYIRKGYLAPWVDGSGEQNETVIEAAAASAKRFAVGGYEVFVDGVVGPWFIEPWQRLAQDGIDVRYIVLRPDEQTTVLRAFSREQVEFFPLTDEVVRELWHSLADLGQYSAHAVDTSAQTSGESAVLLRERLSNGYYRIG